MNNIELITKYSPKAWDTVYKQEAMISLLDATNPAYVQFTGAKTVKIAKWQNGGLHDYYRNNTGDPRVAAAPGSGDFLNNAGFGYQRSAARLVWEEFTLKCDRAAAYQIEKFDNEESGEQLVGLGVTEISRTTIIPEVDAYAFSTIASYCTAGLGNLVVEKIDVNAKPEDTESTKPLAALNKAFVYFSNKEVPIQDQIVFASPNFVNALRETTEVTKFMSQQDYDRKDVNFQIMKYQGRTIVEVSPERLRTDIILFGQEGYSWGNNSNGINFLMVAKSAVIHIVKFEKVRVIGDDLNLAGQGFDGYTIFARIYHDVFVPDNKRVALYCSIEADSVAPKAALDVLVDADGKVKSITTYPGDKLYFVVTSDTAADVDPGEQLTGNITPVRVGDKVTSGTKFYAVQIVNDKYIVKAIYTYTA